MSEALPRARRIAVTGAAGTIGRQACRGLTAAGHWVRGLDCLDQPPADVADFRCCDITDAAAMRDAFSEVEVVVHLAAIPSDRPFVEALLQPNIVGAAQVFAAAQQTGIERLIAVSSSQVVYDHDHEHALVGIEAPYAPPNHYAVTKIFLEGLAQMYARHHGLTTLVMRPGWTPSSAEVLARIGLDRRRRNLYLSFDDAARFFAVAVGAALPPGTVTTVYVQSIGEDATVGFDREPALRLGYIARDVWPDGSRFD